MFSVEGSVASDKEAVGGDAQLGAAMDSSISLRVYANEDSCPTGSIDHVPLLFLLLVGADESAAVASSFCSNCCFCMWDAATAPSGVGMLYLTDDRLLRSTVEG